MARGTPVVAGAWGAAPDVVGDVGRLVDPRDPAAAAEAILELLATPDRDALRRRARERAAHFSWSRTADPTPRMYEELLARKKRRRSS